MTLPNFLIIGAQKCGTTSLHDILSEHPQVNMSEVKEIRYFINNKKYKKGLKYYSEYFKNSKKNHKIIGESSPGYICHPGVPSKIFKDLGSQTKLVLILRDPIKRAFSQYWDERRKLGENLSEKKIIDKHLYDHYTPNKRGYFSRGLYIKFINEYLNYFSKSNLHIIILEELVNDQKKELHKLYDFLEIEKHRGLQSLPKPSNHAFIYDNPFYSIFFRNPFLKFILPKRGIGILFFGKKIPFKYKLPHQDNLRVLKEYYKPFNRRLEKYLGRSLKYWI